MRGTRWFLAHGQRPLRISVEVARFQPGVQAVVEALDSLLAPDQLRELGDGAARFVSAGVPADLARTVAGLSYLLAACDIVAVARRGQEGDDQSHRLHDRRGRTLARQ
jgi:glutamate dehydrogenase